MENSNCIIYNKRNNNNFVQCIPLLIPARQEFEFITNDQLTSTTVDSVAKYDSKNNKNILTFNVVPISALVYSYSGDDVLAQEELSLDDFKIFFLVKIDTDRTRTHEKEELFYPVSAGEVYTTNINGKDVRHILYEGELYIQLQNNEYMYILNFLHSVCSLGGDITKTFFKNSEIF